MAPAVTIVVLLTAAELAERCLRAIAAAREPEPTRLAAALATAREQPEAGVVGSRLLEPDGVSDGGWLVWDDGHTTQLNERNAPAVLAQTVPYPVDFCSGAATLIERAVWEQAGGFDERYFPAVYADVERAALRTRRPSGAFVAAQRPLTGDPARREARLLEAQVAIASEFADWLLAERHVETEAARDAHEAAARLWHERDELHVVLAGVTRERDEALARLSER